MISWNRQLSPNPMNLLHVLRNNLMLWTSDVNGFCFLFGALDSFIVVFSNDIDMVLLPTIESSIRIVKTTV